MSLYLLNLDARTRALMLDEVEYDKARQELHISPYLSGQGQHDYEILLREAIKSGNEETLAARLDEHRRIARTAHRRIPSGGYSIVTVPSNAAEMIAESEFNRYYIRALCRRAIEDGIDELIVYRAKPVHEPRATSEELVESTVDPRELLQDLREHPGDAIPQLGIPGGPNSGISVHLP
jgi:DNA repair photolyase